MKPTFGSAFAGIGGFELGLERAGWECKWQVENDKFCNKILKKFWPNVQRYEDIKEVNPKELEAVGLICGGFPCQSVSAAGRRGGDKDPRWLWPPLYRIICGARPKWVLVENVPGLFSIDSGQLFGGILRDLAESGYDAEWDCIPAAAFGAPHQRYRVFLVAHHRSQRVQGLFSQKVQRVSAFSWCKNVRGIEDLRKRSDLPPSIFRGTRDGIPHWVDRLKSLGNAVVPQVAEWIGRRILEYELANRK